MLKYRILTAFVLVPLVLFILFCLGSFAFNCLIFLISTLCVWEWSYLMGIKRTFSRAMYLLLMLALLYAAPFLPIWLLLLAASAWWVFALVLIIFYPRGSGWWRNHISWRGIMGAFVIIPCYAALHFLRVQAHGILIILFLFVLIWGADSTAYFTGKKCGTSKLALRVSPGKSWQGLAGALLFSIISALVFSVLVHAPYEVWGEYVLISFLTVIFSTVGDLFESMLKRAAGVKDSGRLLPGHGGVLDRMDSLTAAAPIFLASVYFVLK